MILGCATQCNTLAFYWVGQTLFTNYTTLNSVSSQKYVLSYSIYLITSHFNSMYTITPYTLRLISVCHPSAFRSPCRSLSFRPKCLYAPFMFHTRATCLSLLFLLDLTTSYYEALVSSPVIQKCLINDTKPTKCTNFFLRYLYYNFTQNISTFFGP